MSSPKGRVTTATRPRPSAPARNRRAFTPTRASSGAAFGRRDVGVAIAEVEAAAIEAGIAGRAVAAVGVAVGGGGDGDVEDRFEPIGETEVEAEVQRDLAGDDEAAHRRRVGGVARVGHRQPKRAAGVVGEGAEAEVPLPRDVGALDGEDAVAVDRGAKELDVDAALGRGRRRAQRHQRAGEDDGGRDAGPGGRAGAWSSAAHWQVTVPPSATSQLWKRATKTTPGALDPGWFSHRVTPPPLPE